QLGVLAELLLRGVHAHGLGLRLQLGDPADITVLQRLLKPRLGPLAGLHHELRRVRGPLDRAWVGGQRQIDANHRVLRRVGAAGPRLTLRTGPTIWLSSATTTATACCPAPSKAADLAG